MEQQYLPSRWEIELEFVQSLANIQYLNHLAQRNYLKSEEFLNYLDYLNYWREPEYAKYLVYPNCLHILTLLQSEDFRQSIVNPEFMNTVMNDVVERWQQQEESIEKETSYEAKKANEDKNSTEDNYTFEDKNTTEDKNTSDNVTQEASSASPVNTDLVQSTT